MGKLRIRGGKVWREDHFEMNKELVYETNEADQIKELSEEDLLTPGLIDFHVHLWSPATVSAFGVPGEQMYAQGITGGIDAGSFGINNWLQADRFWAYASKMEVKSFLSILPDGLAVFPPLEAPRPEEIRTDRLIERIKQIKNERLLGIKVQLGWLKYKSEETDRELLKRARYIADATDTKLMVHMSGTCLSMEEMVSYFKEGDIITHIYSGFDNTILDEQGKVSPAIKEAADRGIWFDVGHAGKHFSWEVFKKAYSQGVKFQTLGGDITAFSWKNRESFKIYDMFHLLSGFLNAGVSEDAVFQALITNPADYMKKEMKLTDQCLILKKKEMNTVLTDGLGAEQACTYEYLPELFLKNNKIIYNKEEV